MGHDGVADHAQARRAPAGTSIGRLAACNSRLVQRRGGLPVPGALPDGARTRGSVGPRRGVRGPLLAKTGRRRLPGGCPRRASSDGVPGRAAGRSSLAAPRRLEVLGIRRCAGAGRHHRQLRPDAAPAVDGRRLASSYPIAKWIPFLRRMDSERPGSGSPDPVDAGCSSGCIAGRRGAETRRGRLVRCGRRDAVDGHCQRNSARETAAAGTALAVDVDRPLPCHRVAASTPADTLAFRGGGSGDCVADGVCMVAHGFRLQSRRASGGRRWNALPGRACPLVGAAKTVARHGLRAARLGVVAHCSRRCIVCLDHRDCGQKQLQFRPRAGVGAARHGRVCTRRASPPPWILAAWYASLHGQAQLAECGHLCRVIGTASWRAAGDVPPLDGYAVRR